MISLLLPEMNFKALKHQFVQDIVKDYGPEEALSIFYMAVEKVSGWTKSKFIFNQEAEVDAIEIEHYFFIIKSLQAGQPIQYILEEAHFYGLIFSVNPSVLIPRPETEELVDWIMTTVNQPIHSLLDVGTGSGCIAIALKSNLIATDVFALDISAGAIAVAMKNAVHNKVQVHFMQENVLEYEGDLRFDLIVSNPPYVKEDEREGMRANVLDHEPHSALFVENKNPLIFYKAIADLALKNLNDQGYLFFEINEYLGQECMDMLVDKGFKDIVLKKDMQGKDRMIRCRNYH